MLSAPYDSIYEEFKTIIPEERIYTDALRTMAYGTDASFYRLIPKIVVDTDCEDEIVQLLRIIDRHGVAVTFRAAGTSLSGQAISDSILIRMSEEWRNFEILDDATKIALDPGIIGSHANRILAPHGKKIGPDPASIDTCKIGGIVANNASGMCCGVAENSYKTLDSMRIVMADGTILDTGDPQSRKCFAQTHGALLEGLACLRERVIEDESLASLIRKKFKIKNTTGYSLNAIVDFEDPFDILQHLLVGSEGTLAFISKVVYRTVVEHPHKASALMRFPNIESACQAAHICRKEKVAAAELMDRASLASVQDKDGMPEGLASLAPEASALLVEVRAASEAELQQKIDAILGAVKELPAVIPHEFTAIPAEFNVLWNVRRGLFPAVGAVRKAGTTVIIEDVAFPTEKLAEATLDLQALFKKNGYDNAIIFGHALEGNLHFVFTQDFNVQKEIDRYATFMDDVTDMVANKYKGSLKAEHGTGRNMAHFVELEWGRDAYKLMEDIKELFDPKGLLNPGVILNEDPEAHLKDLKPLPVAHDIIDRCIECGFCEPTCPSRELTLTPRQRIVTYRELSRVQAEGTDFPDALEQFKKSFDYEGEATCAADGLCALRCPVSIDTGKFIKVYRSWARGTWEKAVASLAAKGFGPTTRFIEVDLKLAGVAHDVLGDKVMDTVTGALHTYSGKHIPRWNTSMPRVVQQGTHPETPRSALKVVYFPSCVARHMGVEKHDPDKTELRDHTLSILTKAGYEVIYPDKMNTLCCGQPWESKGFMEQADKKLAELEVALRAASEDGKYPILCDTSPCLYRMQEHIKGLTLMEPIQFALTHLLDKLELTPVNKRVALHVTCSSRKMGLADTMADLARRCAREVVVPDDIYCCGFAGDRGFNYPELNEAALNRLSEQLEGCTVGYSTSRTCEIGLSLHGKVPYKNIMFLLDEASWPKA
ncbi:FAD-binding and (Fe-S)-binding domain-containing protein [Pseudodesulfovibrio piezophilus]|uniref:D-lactate dehydrogenase (cytochrome) n=1 Tax=Pseudodesulfovibrio piezophilus (strain DSM 21447 / JCM 15486 / C1TLV30) TaxID=1322246 RepID=M1WK49_PSEP2|nr:FAD-binding and (Fe-S)-binding domain-containing protein [Pseudodesulfovibrio piezophilus]CCH48981.1 Oxidoreductase, FAD/iron-sulfur cluster-binding domain protein [Pseudodesulfovibrio piezophilus C1TLV30]